MGEEHRTELSVHGMDGENAARRAESELEGISGVNRATARPDAGTIVVKHDDQEAPMDDLQQAVRNLGFEPR